MTRTPRRLLLLFGAAATALVAAGVLLLLAFGRTPALSAMPNPNGYDDLLKAGQAVVWTRDDRADMDRDRLQTLVATNAQALRLLRLGLSRRCVVPTDNAIANIGAVTSDLIGLKTLARVLSAEGRLAEMEDRPADAARSYVQAIRLGTEMSRGGLMMNRLVGIACEGVGSIPLVKLVPKLACEQMGPLVGELEKIDNGTVTWPEVLRNENRFVRAQMGNYPNPIKLVSDLWEARSMRRASHERHELAAAHLRLLMTELALRCYRCDQGSAPRSLQQLLPKYLQQVPSDPFSGHPLVYQPAGTNWLLYSLGPDRVDDGGKPIGRVISGDYLLGLGAGKSSSSAKQKGDLLWDSPW
jgi:hypothetical protein